MKLSAHVLFLILISNFRLNTILKAEESENIPYQFHAAILGEHCSDDISWEFGERTTIATFKNISLTVNPEQKVAFYRCKVIWSPLIDSFHTLLSAPVEVVGTWENSEYGTLDIRIGHKLLGLGDAPLLDPYAPDGSGDFSLRSHVQNLHNQDCEKKSKLVTTIRILLRYNEPSVEEATLKLPKLDLKSLILQNGAFQNCAKSPIEN